MKISVIIPVYNRAGLVKKAIESALNQAYKPFEVIVVDDGSTDDLRAELAEGWRGVHVDLRIIPERGDTSGCAQSKMPQSTGPMTPLRPSIGLHRRPRGVSVARNLGIKESKGDWLAFLDSDDYWLPSKLEKQANYHKENPDLFISQTDEVWIRNGKRINPRKYHLKPEGNIFERSLSRCLISPSAVIIKRELLDEVGLFDESLPACEDYDLWLRITCRYPVGLIKEKLVMKTGGHPDQLSQKYWGMDRFRVRSLEKLLKGGFLTKPQEKAARRKLAEKLLILRNGALKRGKEIETIG